MGVTKFHQCLVKTQESVLKIFSFCLSSSVISLGSIKGRDQKFQGVCG